MTLAQKVVILKLVSWIYTALLAASVALSAFDSMSSTRFLMFILPSMMVPVALHDALFKYDVAIRVAILFAVVGAMVDAAGAIYLVVRAVAEDDFEPIVEGDSLALALAVCFAVGRVLLTIPLCRMIEQLRHTPFEQRFRLKSGE